MIIEERFEKFYKNIVPTEAQLNDAIGKCNTTCSRLAKHYYDTEKYNDLKLVFGSYGKNIGVRPPRDVDVLFLMPYEKLDQFKKYEGNGPSALLQDMKKAFPKDFTVNDKLRAWGKVLVVQFAGASHNIEVLPAWYADREEDGFIIPNTENGGSWECYNPVPEIEKVDRLDAESNEKLRKLIRFAKKWTETCSVKISSYELETLACSFVEANNIAKAKLADSIFALFAYMESAAGAEHQSAISTAVKRMNKAHELAAKGHYKKATRKWKQIFGVDFPLSSIEKLAEDFPAAREQFIDRDFSYEIDTASTYTVTIETMVEQDGFRRSPLQMLKNLLRKYKKIEFFARTDVPAPYTMYWKVRNFGKEAFDIGQLRGEIVPDEGYGKKEERTRYRGEHFVECFIVKDKKCVARAGVHVPIGMN